jgi:hypothetical protein
MLLLDTNILIDVLRGEALALAWLEQQQQPHISVILDRGAGGLPGRRNRTRARLAGELPAPATG